MVELVQSGAIGPVGEVHVWFAGSRGGQDRPTDTPPVPEGSTGTSGSARRPIARTTRPTCPGKWRNWWDFGNGTLGDFGCHYMDLPFWALKLKYPTSVEAEGPRARTRNSRPRG